LGLILNLGLHRPKRKMSKNKDEDTGKAEEARKLNIRIMSVEEFIQKYL
jgi:hypothetical protein